MEAPDTGDGEHGQFSGGEEADSGVPIPRMVTIYQLQNHLDPLHPAPGTLVSLGEVAATTPSVPIGGPGMMGFFTEERSRGVFSGIFVTGQATLMKEPVRRGDVLALEGIYREAVCPGGTRSNSMVELKSVSILYRGTDLKPNTVRDPYAISSGGVSAGEYQGVLISISGVSVISSPDPRGLWKVTGGLYVGGMFVTHSPSVLEPLASLTGVLHTMLNEYVLEPRDEGDIVVAPNDPYIPDSGAIETDGPADAGRASIDAGDVPDVVLEADGGDGGMPEDGAVTDAGRDAGALRDCSSRAGHVVISQLSSRGPAGGNDEIVELHNPTGEAVDISGYRLEIASVSQSDGGSSVQWYSRAAVPQDPATSIPPGGYFLFANKNSQYGYQADDYDVKYTTGMTEQGGARISTAGGTVVDTVGFSQAAAEGREVANPCQPSGPCAAAVIRKAFGDSDPISMSPAGADRSNGNGYDTGDNLSDFSVVELRVPRNSKSVPAAQVCE
jgi:hypothetical protein